MVNLLIWTRVALASNSNLLDLFQSEHIRGPVVELGGSRGCVRGDGLRLLDRPPVFQAGFSILTELRLHWRPIMLRFRDGSVPGEPSDRMESKLSDEPVKL